MENNIIEVDIKSRDGIFNPFNENQISEELGNYIFRNSKKGEFNSKLIINIDNKILFTDDEKEKIVDAIREYFGLLVRTKLAYSRFNSVKKLGLFMIGIILMLLSNVTRDGLGFLIPEVVSIAGCVAIWEAVYIILFVDNKNRFEIRKLKELTMCEINFINDK